MSRAIAKDYGITLAQMMDRIESAYMGAFDDSPNYDEYDFRHLRLFLLEFMLTHGDDAIVRMFGFIRYIQKSEKTTAEKEQAIRSTISHDLAGRADALMQPRTWAYLEYAKQ